MLAAEEAQDGNYADLVKRYESGGDYAAMNDASTAAGAYQITYGTLIDYGMIDESQSSRPDFDDNTDWDSVTWTGKHGVESLSDFHGNESAQDAVFSELTQRNWNTISGSTPVGEEVNGVPMTQSGALNAAHMLGPGGYQDWASCGFQASCLDPEKAASNNMTVDEWQDHLMNRVAEGGGYDSDMVMDGDFGGGNAAQMPEISLMPWKIVE